MKPEIFTQYTTPIDRSDHTVPESVVPIIIKSKLIYLHTNMLSAFFIFINACSYYIVDVLIALLSFRYHVCPLTVQDQVNKQI